MFTIVDSVEKKTKQSFHKDASHSPFINSANLSLTKFSKLLSVNNDFSKLQLDLFALTFVISIFISLFTGILINSQFGVSILIGSIAGIFYLRLLAKSIGNLGKSSSGVSKVQLLIPVSLFIFASKIEFIEILPALIGFFIYKPAIIFYFSRP